MKVLVQWSTTEPGDWQEINVTPGRNPWKDQPRRPVPRGGEQLDGEAGWVFAVAVDGVIFEGFDHYAVDVVGSGRNARLMIFGWVDDIDDFDDEQTLGYKWGEVWSIGAHRPDSRFGGRENTHQIKTVFAEDLDDMGRFFPQETSGGPVELRPWSEFAPPAEELWRHGVWVRSEGLWRRHAERRRPVDWREWA